MILTKFPKSKCMEEVKGLDLICCKPRTYDHTKIRGILPLIVNQSSDYITPYTDFDKVYKVQILTRSEWNKGYFIEGC